MNYNNYDENDEYVNSDKVDKVKVISNAFSLTIAIVASAIIIFALYVVFKPLLSATKSYGTVTLTQEQIERLDNAAKIVSDNYLYEYDQDKMVDGAIDGMIASLENPFSYYLFEDEYQESLNSGANASYCGIGVHLTYSKDNNAILVLGIMPNSPAEEAQMRAGDIIVQVDDLVVNTDTYIDAVDAIKGEEGQSVKLKVFRDGEVLDFEIVRQKISENNVVSEILDGNIGYIKVFAFDNGVFEQFRDEYVKLRAKNVRALIIDLRNNPGGYVADTLNMLNLLVPEIPDVLKIVSKVGDEKTYKTTSTNQIDIPLAVIVNENSASASEIFASVIRDAKKGVVIGKNTFGKGVVQKEIPVPGHGAIDIVYGQYFTPSGVVIQDNGIKPDIEVDLPEGVSNSNYIERDKDTQLQRAIENVTK